MAEYAVHRCQLFEHTPRAIQCMASYEPSGGVKVLAVGRENGAIELIKCLKTGFYTYMVIPGSSKRNLEDLLWCNGRLFSAELQGVITEYDLLKGMEKYSEDSYGGAVWCLASGHRNSRIVAGCEDGSLKIFTCGQDKLTFEKSLDKQEGRILSCAIHPNNETLASGSVDVIRIWSYKSGHAIQRIRLESSKISDTIVWAVRILSDHTIVSGDSNGKICFWNGKNATLNQSFQNHHADILSLCVSEDEAVVYAAGVDPRVIAIHRSSPDENESKTQLPLGMERPPEAQTWVKGETLQKHTHDVRALTLVGDFVVSGGVDTNILLYNFKTTLRKKEKKMSAFPHKSNVHIAEGSRILLLQYPKQLDIWRLGTPESVTGGVGQVISLLEEPTKLFQINAPPGDTDEIMCSAISFSGRWITYATKTALRLFWLNLGLGKQEELSVTKVPARWVKLPAATVFTPNSNHLAVSSFGGKIYIMKLNSDGHAHLEHVLKGEADSRSPSVLLAANDKYLAAADLNDEIKVYDFMKAELKCVLPKQDVVPTALAFKPSSNCLIVAYQDHSIVEFDASKDMYTGWCRKALAVELNLIKFPAKYCKRPKNVPVLNTSPIIHISFSHIEPNKIMLASHKSVFFLEYSTEMLKNIIAWKEKQPKISKDDAKRDKKTTETPKCPVKRFNKFDHLLYTSFLDGGTSLLVVERPWRDIFDKFPPTLYQKKYGT